MKEHKNIKAGRPSMINQKEERLMFKVVQNGINRKFKGVSAVVKCNQCHPRPHAVVPEMIQVGNGEVSTKLKRFTLRKS
jgi:hypothetical protein